MKIKKKKKKKPINFLHVKSHFIESSRSNFKGGRLLQDDKCVDTILSVFILFTITMYSLL